MKQQHLKGSALCGGLEGGLQAGVVVRSLRAVEAGVRTAQLVPRQIVVGEPRHKLQAGSAAEWTTLRLSRTRSRIAKASVALGERWLLLDGGMDRTEKAACQHAG